MNSPNPNDVERFVAAVFGCGDGGAQPYMLDALNLPVKSKMERNHSDTFFHDFIINNPPVKEVWDIIHPDAHKPSSTKGMLSEFFFGKDEPAPVPPPPAKPVVPQDPLKTRKAGTINAPVWPKGVDRQAINQGVQQRMNIQRRQPWESAWDNRAPQQQASLVMRPDRIPPARERMNCIPEAPRGNLVRVQPQWNPQLQNMHIINHQLLPRELIVDDVTLAEMNRTESFHFPHGPQCPVLGDVPIPRSMVHFQPVDTDQASIAQYMDQQGPECYQPQWVQNSIAYGRLSHSLEKMSLSSTAAKSGAHSVRAAQHAKAKKDFDELIRGTDTIY